MQTHTKKLLFPVLLLAISICIPLTIAAELIEPTRSLRGGDESVGKLSVTSDPPKLDVILDGVKIGKTPIILRDIKPGLHVLRIRDSEKEFIAESGKPFHLSWHNGSFIVAPPKENKRPIPEKQQEAKAPAETPPPQRQSSEQKDEHRPLYWPLNPRGPIY